jgi:hypothetical protein
MSAVSAGSREPQNDIIVGDESTQAVRRRDTKRHRRLTREIKRQYRLVLDLRSGAALGR